MKAIYQTNTNTNHEERLLVSSNLSHPGAAFRMIRIETTDMASGLRNGGSGPEQPYEPGTFIKEVHVHVMPLLGLVQGRTAALAEEDTYALFLGDAGRPTAVNVGDHQPGEYLLMDYSQFEKLASEVERINFWVVLTGYTSWPLVKYTLYEGYDKRLNRSVFTGYSANGGQPSFGHYRYSTVELARIERSMFDTGVFRDYLDGSVQDGVKDLAIPA
jgi:hypothetical protein